MKSAKAAQFLSPLGEKLVFYAMRGREALGQPYSYEVDVLSEDPNVELSALLGQPATVALERYEGGVRQFSGFVTHFSLIGGRGRHVQYRAVLRPWLWLLSYSRTSRIFHKKSVPKIIAQIFRERGFSDFSDSGLSGEYREWEYVVQYRESDLNFVSRLMEQEGIYYYFTHEKEKHTLVLADSPSSHQVAPEYEEGIKYFVPVERERRDQEHIDGWVASKRLRSGSFSVGDFDFKKPSFFIFAQAFVKHEHPHSDYEVFDFPGEVGNTGEAEREARIQLQEHHSEYETVEATGNPRGLGAGSLFPLTQFPREDQNKRYLVVDALYDVRVGEYESTSDIEDKDPEYRVRFSAIDAERQYRAPRTTRKPVVEGPQTAIVITESDQDIWTDEYGRVQLMFHWDVPAQDKSCWVRVSQVWAGANFGAMHLPRAGQEVIVDFLEGDPDRPIVTGRVYNADNMPPWPLSKNQTKSGIRSRSTKGGTAEDYNELMFEDKKGEELVNLQAQKDLHVEVKNDETDHIAGNRTTDVDKNETTTIGEKETHHVKGMQEETVDQGIKQTVTAGIDRTVVSGGVKEQIMGDVSKTVVGGLTQTMTGALAQTAAQGVTITTPQTVTINAVGGFSVIAPGGSKILAPAGHTLIAPGGQTTVDNFFNKLGGTLMQTYNTMIDYHLLANSFALITLDNSVMKYDTTQFQITNNPIKFEMRTTFVRKTILGLYTSALVIMK